MSPQTKAAMPTKSTVSSTEVEESVLTVSDESDVDDVSSLVSSAICTPGPKADLSSPEVWRSW